MPFSSMRALAAGVVTLATRFGGEPWGLTISWCCSVSLEPPQLLGRILISEIRESTILSCVHRTGLTRR